MKPVGLALIALGVVLLVLGIRESYSFASDVSRFFTGNPTDKTMWLLIGGIVAAGVGAAGMFRGSKST